MIYILIYFYVQDAQLFMFRDTQLKVFPFAGAQHLSDFTFTWKRNRVEKGTENELPIKEVMKTALVTSARIKHFL